MKIKRWINNILSVVLVAILLLVIFFIFSSKINGDKPKVFGYELMTVLSGSMEPNIKTGSIIAVKPISNPDKCEVGEVVTYQSLDEPNALITHRIINIENSGNGIQYITKGDNNNSEDPKPIPSSKVVGTYANFTVPGLGYMFNFIKSKNGIIYMLIIPGALLIISQLISMWRTIINMEEKEKIATKSVENDSSENV